MQLDWSTGRRDSDKEHTAQVTGSDGLIATQQ